MTRPPASETQSMEADMASCVLDRGKLATMEELIGKEKSAMALQKFKTDLDKRLAEIAADTIAIEEKAAHAHKLVGTAGAIGFQELSEVCLRFETAVKRDATDLHPLLDEVVSAGKRAMQELALLTGS